LTTASIGVFVDLDQARDAVAAKEVAA